MRETSGLWTDHFINFIESDLFNVLIDPVHKTSLNYLFIFPPTMNWTDKSLETKCSTCSGYQPTEVYYRLSVNNVLHFGLFLTQSLLYTVASEEHITWVIRTKFMIVLLCIFCQSSFTSWKRVVMILCIHVLCSKECIVCHPKTTCGWVNNDKKFILSKHQG